MKNNAITKSNGNAAGSFDNLFDTFFGSTLRRFLDGNFYDLDRPLTAGTVPVNVREHEHHYEMDVIAPGCRKEDFSLSVHNNELTISFERKTENRDEDTSKGWVRNEFVQQPFRRSFTVDDTVDVKGITARYVDGILRLQIPKSDKAKEHNRLIEIQ